MLQKKIAEKYVQRAFNYLRTQDLPVPKIEAAFENVVSTLLQFAKPAYIEHLKTLAVMNTNDSQVQVLDQVRSSLRLCTGSKVDSAYCVCIALSELVVSFDFTH